MQEGEKSLLLVEKGDEIDKLKGDLKKESRKRQRAETRWLLLKLPMIV